MDQRSPRTDAWADLNLLERIALVSYVVAEIAFFVLLYVGFFAALLVWRPGGYLVLVGFTVYFVGRNLAMVVFARHEGDLATLSRHEQLVLLTGFGAFLAGVFGIYAALLGWHEGAWVLVAGVAGHLVAHLAVGMSAYRRVMAHPWPQVPALEDDDDW